MCLVPTANLIRLSLAFHVPTMTRRRLRAEYDAGRMPGFAASRTTTWRLFLTGTNVLLTIPICGQETASSSSPSLIAASTAVTIWPGIAGSSSDGNSLTGECLLACECSPVAFRRTKHFKSRFSQPHPTKLHRYVDRKALSCGKTHERPFAGRSLAARHYSNKQ